MTHLDQYIIGQDDAKRTLARACYCHAFSCATTVAQAATVWPDNNVLLSGPSGSGKSELIRILTKYLKIPLYQADCTELTPSGYKGKNVQTIVEEIEAQWVGEHIAPTACIMVWDEFDKLRFTGSDAGEYKRMTQSDMLRLIEGGKVSSAFNTSRIMHIAMGAFVGIEDFTQPKNKTIGFAENYLCTSNDPQGHSKVLPDHYITYGLIPELIGRFSRFATLDPLTKENMADIIQHSKISFHRRKVAEYKHHGAKLVFSPAAIEELAQCALRHPSGARGLRQILTEVLEPWDFQITDLRIQGITEIHFDKDAIKDGTKARVVMGNPSSPLQVAMPDYKAIHPEDDQDTWDDLCIL